MKQRRYFLHALSPLHAGTGHSIDIIDLPLARMRSTGIPIVPGSSIKGVLRDARRVHGGIDQETLFAIFGPEADSGRDHAGALFVSDARLLALPVRSFRGTFAWVTSRLLLFLAKRDLVGIPGLPDSLPQETAGKASVCAVNGDRACRVVHGLGDNARVYLEDLDLAALPCSSAEEWASFLAARVYPDEIELFRRRFVVVEDEIMTFLWETATQLDTRIRIDPERRTADGRALWIEESLPPETLLLGLLTADHSRRTGKTMKADEVLDKAVGPCVQLQFGGKATVGRGLCKVIPLDAG